MILERLVRKINLRQNRGILVFGNCYKRMSKNSHVVSHSFAFNKDWDQRHLLSKRKHGRLEINDGAKLFLGKGSVMINGATLVSYPNSVLKIGDNVLINSDCEIYCSDRIEIGNDTVISNNCIIRDCDIHKMNNIGPNHKPINIGNHVWIGTNCIILKGVTIGDGSVVGAGSVVTCDVPPKTMIAGNPAKIIKTDIEWER